MPFQVSLNGFFVTICYYSAIDASTAGHARHTVTACQPAGAQVGNHVKGRGDELPSAEVHRWAVHVGKRSHPAPAVWNNAATDVHGQFIRFPDFPKKDLQAFDISSKCDRVFSMNEGDRHLSEMTGSILPLLLADVKELPSDPDWEAIEVRIAAHTAENIAPVAE